MNLTSNKLKLLAYSFMAFDHTMSLLIDQGTFLYALSHIPGRIVAPIICYLLVEGYYHTRDIKKYLMRLFTFAIISHLPYVVLFDLNPYKTTSVMWGLFLGLVCIHLLKKNLPAYLKGVFVLILVYLARPADWYYVTILWMIGFDHYRGNLKKQMIAFLLIGLLTYILPGLLRSPMMFYRCFIFLAVPFIYAYNQRRGHQSSRLRWLMYWFYPLHFIILLLIKYSLHL